MAKLTFVLEDGQEIVVPLAERVTLGRAEDNDVVVDDDRISKRHAELVRNADGSVQVFDTNSTAGTFVNGERVSSRTVLHGDQLSFGPLAAMLDLQEGFPNGNAASPAKGKPAKGGRIGTRKKDRNEKRNSAADTQTALPPDEILARLKVEHQAEMARLEAEKSRLQAEVGALQADLRDWQQRSEKERTQHNARVESLRAEEERLAPLKAAVLEVENVHAEWVKSIKELARRHEEKNAALQRLTGQHDQKAAELQRITNDEVVARNELEALDAHRGQTLAHLEQIRGSCAHDEAALDDLRRQLAEVQTRNLEAKNLADVREDQVRAAEKKLEELAHRRTQVEAHIHELVGTEERLVQALARCRDAEADHAGLVSTLANLEKERRSAGEAVRELETRITALEDARLKAVSTSEAAASAREQAESLLQRRQDEVAECEKTLATRKTELDEETRRLESVVTRRAEIEQQCVDLAATDKKLAEARDELTATEKQMADSKVVIIRCNEQISMLQSTLKGLAGDEAAACGRVAVLHARENDMRAELASLAAAERTERARFEGIRQLAAEAAKEHATHKEKLDVGIESTQRDLEELVSRLTPLREWKEAMDGLYARLSALPQDSSEAQELWREIEREKAGLAALITAAKAQTQMDKLAACATPAATPVRRPGSGTGSVLIPGATQETTLRARLAHLRENVQREETRLENLRLERVRHDGQTRSSPAAEAMLREQIRHLELKLRQEDERHHSLQRAIEASQAEEEKRRERLAEMERRLAELRSDIVEAERQRSELRQQAELIQTGLKNHEAALDRVMRKPAE